MTLLKDRKTIMRGLIGAILLSGIGLIISLIHLVGTTISVVLEILWIILIPLRPIFNYLLVVFSNLYVLSGEVHLEVKDKIIKSFMQCTDQE